MGRWKGKVGGGGEVGESIIISWKINKKKKLKIRERMLDMDRWCGSIDINYLVGCSIQIVGKNKSWNF